MSKTQKISISLDEIIYGPLKARLFDECERAGRSMTLTELISKMLARSMGIDISNVKFRSPRTQTNATAPGPLREHRLMQLEKEFHGYWEHRDMVPLDSYEPSDPFRQRMEAAIALAKQGLIDKPEGFDND